MRLEAVDGPPIEISAPRPRFGGSYGPHFLEKHEKKGISGTHRELFFVSAISQGVVVGYNKCGLGLVCVPPRDLSPLNSRQIKSHINYPGSGPPEPGT